MYTDGSNIGQGPGCWISTKSSLGAWGWEMSVFPLF